MEIGSRFILFFSFGIFLWPGVSLGVETVSHIDVPLDHSVTGSMNSNHLALVKTSSSGELDKNIEKQEVTADKKEAAQDETIIDAWARNLSQNALQRLEKDPEGTSLFLGSARGILFVIPEKLGTLLGIHVGGALGFYRKNDSNWGLPVIYQVESEIPIKWNETSLLIIPIRDEKTQVSMILPQWSHSSTMAAISDPTSKEKESFPVILENRKNYFWPFPKSIDFPQKIKFKLHFNREMNEELYGRKNIQAIDIYFDSMDPPLCMKELWNRFKTL